MSYKNLKKPNCRFLTALALGLTLTLAGCGSGGKKGEGLLGDPAPNTSSSSSSSSSTSGTGGQTSGAFVDPVSGAKLKAAIVSDNTELSYGQSKKVSVTFTNDANAVVLPTAEITVSSPCQGTRKTATISGPEINDKVYNYTYTSKGCVGDDTITFSAIATSKKEFIGEVTVKNKPEAVAEIQKVKPVPEALFIAGAGEKEESTVSFIVIGQSGKAMAGQSIDFKLEGAAGGVSLSTTSEVTNEDGKVSVKVKSGTTPGIITVRATHKVSLKEQTSDSISVASGLPVNRSDGVFNLTVTKRALNAFNQSGQETTVISANIPDPSGNSIPDGTLVTFQSGEGGHVEENCRTVNSSCSVTWTPKGTQPPDGRIQIFATVKGSEEFQDLNGNLIFDEGDIFNAAWDLPEPFSDQNNNGQYDIGEWFVNTNGNSGRDGGDGKWNGVGCKDPARCSPSGKVDLGAQTTLVISQRAVELCAKGDFEGPLWVRPGETKAFGGLFLSDGNDNAKNPAGMPCLTGNSLPNGTKMSFSSTAGTIHAGNSTVVGVNESDPNGPKAILYEAPKEVGSKSLILKVEIPNTETAVFTWPIYISETPPDDTTSIPDTSNAGTFTDPTLNQKVWVDITAAVGTVAFDTTREITLTFKDELAQPKVITSIISATSACVISSRAQLSAPVVASNTVKFIYTAKGCVGDDLVSFNAAGNSKTVSVGSYKLTTTGESVGGINFVGATPSQIPIATGGTGSGSLATVTFKVVGQSGNGVAGENVKFSIVGGAGGVALVNVASLSDANGLVKTQVRSGTTPNNVTVLATVESNGAKASSLGLAVASGLSAPGRFSISLSTFNPHAYNFDSGSDAVTVSATVADASGNPVLDGTLVNFTSPEGGLITPTCLTVKGRCTVGLQSTGIQPNDGRITISATVKGIERFTDNNGNLLFDNGDMFDLASHDVYEPFTDENDDGIYQLGEPFVDSDLDGVRSVPDGKWNGLNCLHSTLCGAANKLVDIQDSAVVNLSGYTRPTICSSGTFGSGTLTVIPGGTLSLSGLYLSDGNPFATNSNLVSPCATGNSLPGDTKVTFSVSTGTLLSPKEVTTVSPYERVPNGPFFAVFTAPTTPGVVILSMKVELPPHAGAKDPATYTYNWTVNVQ